MTPLELVVASSYVHGLRSSRAAGGRPLRRALTPDPALAAEDGAVRSEYAWAALDCPTSAPVADLGGGPLIVPARLHARIERPIVAGAPHRLTGACAMIDPTAGRTTDQPGGMPWRPATR